MYFTDRVVEDILISILRDLGETYDRGTVRTMSVETYHLYSYGIVS